MMRLKAASIVSVRLFGKAQAKKSVVSRINGKTTLRGMTGSFMVVVSGKD